MEKIVALCKRRGFIYQGSEIYGGLAGTWDYGPLGVALKKNIENLWWKTFVDSREDMYGIDSAILMNAKVWEASGHVGGFSDPLVECSKCKKRFRADHLLERSDQVQPLSRLEVEPGERSDLCLECGGKLGETRQFNMMFGTRIGPTADKIVVRGPLDLPQGNFALRKIKGEEVDDPARVYLRPETAQGMFVNFKNVVDSFHPKLPFGIAQVGKAFRNEISPRDFTFRAREFEIMEFEYFIRGEEWEKQFAYWQGEMMRWVDLVGIAKKNVHEIKVPEGELAHYSKRTTDLYFDFPFGQKELYGLAYRTDFDLKNHSTFSGQKLEYTEEGAEPITPHVIEPTFWRDRTVLAVLTSAYTEDEMNGEKRIFLKLKPALAPITIAIFPLLKNKPELVKKAREVFDSLRSALRDTRYTLDWDDNGNIGKRYRRQDEIGTPFCITVDFDSLEKGDVTVRDRDTGKQERVKISELTDYMRKLF